MLTFLFPPSFAGGTKQALELAKGLRRQDVECIFMAANFENAKSFEIFEGSAVHRFKTGNSKRLKYLVFSLQVCLKLLSQRKHFDLIFLHSLRPFSLLIVLLAKFLGKPTVVTLTLIGNDDPQSLNRKSLLWRLEMKSLEYADRIICKSSALKDSCLMEGLEEQKLVSISNGVDVRQFKPMTEKQERRLIRQELGFADSSFIVAFVGRVCKRKGCDILLETWEAIAEKYPELNLLLMGPVTESFDADADDRFAERLCLAKANASKLNVRFLGKTPHHQIARYLGLSDCFVFPSRKEGLPNAVLEAMATGLPTIAMRIPGITDDIIENGIDGIIVDDYNFRALAAAIERVVNDRKLAKTLSSNAVKKIRDNFSIDAIAARHRALYQTLIG